MKRESRRRVLGWCFSASLAALTVMLATLVAQAADAPPAAAPTEKVAAPEANNGVPQIIDSTPKCGATDVDPALTEISVTFDRDMREGMSWTGGAPLFPSVDETKKATWTNPRTCVLPVKLAQGTYYRVGINASSYQNFKSKQGAPAPSSVICFVTQGADDKIKQQVQAPTIVKLEPANGVQDVDPATKALSVTFNVPMGAGMSWTHSGPNFPPTPAGTKPAWSDDQLTCTMPVTLEAGHDYEIGLNHPRYNNFQSRWGVPLEPVLYKFRTAGTSSAPGNAAEARAAAPKAYPIEIKANEVREYPSLKIEFGALRLELGAVTVVPVTCELGVTGAVLLGNGTYRYAPEADKVIEGVFSRRHAAVQSPGAASLAAT
jgi:hypothetical protein